jgi:hypothetical protein
MLPAAVAGVAAVVVVVVVVPHVAHDVVFWFVFVPWRRLLEDQFAPLQLEHLEE